MKPVLVISERDNVATALQALEPGRDLTLGAGRSWFVTRYHPDIRLRCE